MVKFCMPFKALARSQFFNLIFLKSAVDSKQPSAFCVVYAESKSSSNCPVWSRPRHRHVPDRSIVGRPDWFCCHGYRAWRPARRFVGGTAEHNFQICVSYYRRQEFSAHCENICSWIRCCEKHISWGVKILQIFFIYKEIEILVSSFILLVLVTNQLIFPID